MAIELEKIQPWDGQSGTGADARGVIDRNFEKIETELETTSENLVQLAGDNIIEGLIIEYGSNLFNPNFAGGGLNIWDKGGDDTVINTLGQIVTATGWYTGNVIKWGGETQIFANRLRSWVQYDANFNVIGVYFPAGVDSNYIINRIADAAYVAASVPIELKSTTNFNYGAVGKPFEAYKEIVRKSKYTNSPIEFECQQDYAKLLKNYLLSESFSVQGATYNDGIINSPVNVIWADGSTGTLTITRNADMMITKIVATYNGTVNLWATLIITRNADNEVINTQITIS